MTADGCCRTSTGRHPTGDAQCGVAGRARCGRDGPICELEGGRAAIPPVHGVGALRRRPGAAIFSVPPPPVVAIVHPDSRATSADSGPLSTAQVVPGVEAPAGWPEDNRMVAGMPRSAIPRRQAGNLRIGNSSVSGGTCTAAANVPGRYPGCSAISRAPLCTSKHPCPVPSESTPPSRRRPRGRCSLRGTYGAHVVEQAISGQRLLDLSPNVEGETSRVDVEGLHTRSTYVRESNL